MRWSLVPTFLVALLACGDDDSVDASTDATTDTTTDVGDSVDAPVDVGIDAPLVDAGTDAGALVEVPRPPPVVFPDTIGTLTVELRTADVMNAGTDDPLEVCLSASRCFRLDTPEVNDFRRGDIDVFQIEGVDMPRSEVDRVAIRTASPIDTNNDRYTPGCMALRFDGEPVYCQDTFPNHIGTGPSEGEVVSWSDPAGLHEVCVTCEERGIVTHGTVLGAPSTDTVRVWVRTDATRDVALMMAEPGDDPVAVAWARPRPETDYNTVLTVDGLPSGTAYEYFVEVDDTRTGSIPVSTTDETSAVRFGFGSCSQELAQPIFTQLALESLDLFFFVGDIHYGNTGERAAHRWNYRRFRSIPDRRGFLAATPMLATWDDHDFVGNNSDGGCVGREDALEAFREAWPNPSFGIDGTPGAFTRHRMGSVDFFLTDCRYHRPRVDDPRRNCAAEVAAPSDRAGGLLGSAQFDWLVSGLSSSTAPFKVVACGSLFTSSGVDSWASFPEGRDRLMRELADADVQGVVLASGDIHRSEIRQFPREGAYTLTELVSSPLAQYARDDNPGRTSCSGSDAEFCYHWDSYITVDATAEQLHVEVHDEDGAIIHMRDLALADLQ